MKLISTTDFLLHLNKLLFGKKITVEEYRLWATAYALFVSSTITWEMVTGKGVLFTGFEIEERHNNEDRMFIKTESKSTLLFECGWIYKNPDNSFLQNPKIEEFAGTSLTLNKAGMKRVFGSIKKI